MKSTHYGKYVFNTIEQAKEKKADIYNNEEVPNFHSIQILGAELLQAATYDEDGELLTEEVYAENCIVDVIWRDLEEVDHPYGWKSYAVTPENPLFEISGQNYKKDKL